MPLGGEETYRKACMAAGWRGGRGGGEGGRARGDCYNRPPEDKELPIPDGNSRRASSTAKYATADPVRVMMIGRENYLLRLVVAVRSLTDNLGTDQSLSIRIVEDGLSNRSKERLMHSWDLERTTVEWLPVDLGGRIDPITVSGLPPIYLTRLSAPSYVPEDWDRLIFLDPDVLVVTDIGLLWRQPLGDHHALATRDPFVPILSHPDGLVEWKDAGLPPRAPYLNAAVMLIDVAKWRRDEVPRAAADFVDRFGDSIRFGDQDVLNAVLHDRWGELDPRWQVHPRLLQRPRLAARYLDAAVIEKMSRDPRIYHFGGRLKPWDYRAQHRSDALFYEYLDRTDWRGWRPPASLKGGLFRLYDSPLRDWLHPLEVRAGATARALARSFRRRHSSR